MKGTKLILAGIVVLSSFTHRATAALPTTFSKQDTSVISSSQRDFTVALTQPGWWTTEFAADDGFERWISSQMTALKPYLSSQNPTLVVLTELNGLPLYLRGAKLATRSPSFTAAIALLLFKYLPSAMLVSHRTGTTLVQSLQILLAPDVVSTYLRVCQAAAARYGVYLVTGSSMMPHLRQEGSVLVLDDVGIYNESLFFNPHGESIGATDKVHLTPEEGPAGLNLTGGSLDALHVYPTPVGDLGIAISLDAFEPDVIKRLETQGATVLVQPDANGQSWTATAHDGTGRRLPLVWLESSWRAVQQSSNLRYALNPMVVGNFLGVPFDGQSAIISKASEAPHLESYITTTPRPGFLRLMPWVNSGSYATLQATSKALAPGSGDPLENRYRTGVLYADLTLPASRVSAPPTTVQEQALRAYLRGQAQFPLDPAVAALRILWPILWILVALWGLYIALRSRLAGIFIFFLGLLCTLVINL